MATIKSVIRKGKIDREGLCKVEIAISHKSKTTYIPTKYKVKPSEFSGGFIKGASGQMINLKIVSLIQMYEERLMDIHNASLYDVSQLREMITSEKKSKDKITLHEWLLDYQSNLISAGRNSYASILQRGYMMWEECFNGDTALTDIKPTIIERFQTYMYNRKKKLSDETIRMYLGHIKTIINSAIKNGVVKYEVHPFVSVRIGSGVPRSCEMTIQELKSFIEYVPDTVNKMKAHDMFMLSFYLGGMNLKDIVNVVFDNDDFVKYERIKVRNKLNRKQEVVLPICQEALHIILKYRGSDNMLDLGLTGDYKTLLRRISGKVGVIAKELNINTGISFYSARKMFGQCCEDIGVPDKVKEYCLGHTQIVPGSSRFYGKIRLAQATDYMAVVRDYVMNPDKYQGRIKEVFEVAKSTI